MKKYYLLVNKHRSLAFILSASSFILILYFFMIHKPYDELKILKIKNQDLRLELSKNYKGSRLTDPRQHDPLINELIALTKANHLEITNLKFNKSSHGNEEFNGEIIGSYLNSLKFIEDLFQSKYVITPKEVLMSREATYLKSQVIFEIHP